MARPISISSINNRFTAVVVVVGPRRHVMFAFLPRSCGLWRERCGTAAAPILSIDSGRYKLSIKLSPYVIQTL